jgi:predicted nuclease of predicted toxin-antitoxin system
MRLLIDECVDERLRYSFPGHDCQTARYAKLAGLKNGDLLSAAETAGFDVLVTVDQSIPDQQNLAGRKIALLILSAPTNRLRDLRRLIPAALAALDAIRPGQVERVSKSAGQ